MNEMLAIILFFVIFVLFIIVAIIVLSIKSFKEVKSIIDEDKKRLELRNTLEERPFTIIDILNIEEKDINTYILIKDENNKSLYLYYSFIDAYKWKDDEEGYLEPEYINLNKKEEIYLYNYKNDESYPIEFNKTSGKFKLVKERGHIEVQDDKLIIYKENTKSEIKLRKIKHANKSYDINNIHNCKLIDCFITYDKHSDE